MPTTAFTRIRMSVKALSLTTVAFLGLGTGANAVTLTSTPLFAGTAQANAVCYFLNAGKATVATPTITIRDEAGVAVPVLPQFNTCPSTGVLPGHTCGIGVFILNNQAYNCTIVSAGAVVTGGLELRDSSGTTLIDQPLQHIPDQDQQ
jgi:hypothetical protein